MASLATETDDGGGSTRVRTLVTGGAGFIGSTLVDRLAAAGHEVVVVDNLSSGRVENLADALASGRVHLAEVDITGADLEKVVAEARPEAVYHLAAQIDVRRSVADPLFDARVNVLGTVALARAALDADCRRLVFASSGGTVYGEPDPASLPVDERHPALATSPYGVSKRTAEDYLASFAPLYGLEPVSLRLGNVYGPRQDPHGEAGVVAIFCNRLLSGEPVTIFGDGRQTRDYVFVEDVVDAFLAAGERDGAAGARVNVGTGVETSVLGLYQALREVTGFGPEPGFAPPRPGELQRIALDSAEAGRALGWQRRVDLPEGLARTWNWAFQQVNAGSVGG
jgi:UDP-glucose 4-epimerase